MKKKILSGSLYVAAAMIGSVSLQAAPGLILPQLDKAVKQQSIPSKYSIQKGNKTVSFRKGEVLVKYKSIIRKEAVKASIGNSNIDEIKEFKTLSKETNSSYMLIKSNTLNTEELMQRIKADPNVEYVEPNYLYQEDKIPNDPSFNKLWGQHNTGQTVNGKSGTPDADIDAPEAWNKATGSKDIVIAVIDTGVDYLHEDLAANMWKNPKEIPGNNIDDDHNGYVDDVYGINAINDSGDPMDVVGEHGGHGTHVAGTIAAVGNNGKGVVGVSWHSKIMALKFLGKQGGTSADSIKCLEYVLAQKKAGVNIVATNNSWGGGGPSNAVKDAIEATNKAGIVFIAAAGNEGLNNDNTPHYPSSYDLPGIISVAATDQDDELASFSNYGLKSVDLSAPGTNIYSSVPRGPRGNAGISFDNFENGAPGWTKYGWDVSDDQEIFANPNFPVPSPTHFLSDSPGTNYAVDKTTGIFKTIDLSAYKNKRVDLSFSTAFALAEGDFGAVGISPDTNPNHITLLDVFQGGEYWHGPLDYVIPESFKTSSFTIGFAVKSNNDNKVWAGMLVDNVLVSDDIVSLYGYKDGTSMATPQVAGAAALIASVCGKESVAQLKNRILSSVDKIPSLDGKVVTGGRLNINKAIANCGSTPPPATSKPMVPIYYILGL